MGIRAERREKRIADELAKQTVLPGGGTHMPTEFMLKTCRECDNCRTGTVDMEQFSDKRISLCKSKYRKPVYETEQVTGGVTYFPPAMFIAEGCPHMVLLLMEADVSGMYEKVC